MSLFDVDPKSADRSAPSTNGRDVQLQESIKAHKTKSVNYVTDASNSTTVAAFNGQLTIVQVQDVTVTPDNTSTTTSPGFSTFSKIIYQVAHGLSYTPGLAIYWNFNFGGPPEYVLLPFEQYTPNGASTVGTWILYRATVDSTYVYIYEEYMTHDVAVSSANGTLNFKYYLFQQTSS